MENKEPKPIYQNGKRVGYAYSSVRQRTWIRQKFRQAVKYKCQSCKKHESQVGTLELHRVKRGSAGGKYTLVPLDHPKQNVMVICKGCHNKIHGNEFLEK